LCQEAFGVNAHIRDVTERLAAEGYVAIAPELFHRTGAGFQGKYDDFQAVMPHYTALNDSQIEADLQAAFDWLRSNGVSGNTPIVAVGFCMGGRVALQCALTLPVACAVSFYGGGIAPNPMNPGLLHRMSQLRAPVLLFWGGKDQHIDASQVSAVVDALREAKKDYTNVVFSEADHGFFCDARPSYHRVAAAEAWPFTLAFLSTHTSAGAGTASAGS
jgi:carboxymethylenebutenolidase